MSITEQMIEATVFELMKKASIELPQDVQRALKEGYEREETITARGQLDAIMQNVQIAHDKQIGLCQDTGVPIIYADLGIGCKLEGNPALAMSKAVARATKEVPLRQNVINPLTKENSGTNTGWGIPYVHWDMIPDEDYLELTAVPKGFGSEMRGTLVWVLTSEDVGRAAVKAVLDVVEDSMGEPCPPVIHWRWHRWFCG